MLRTGRRGQTSDAYVFGQETRRLIRVRSQVDGVGVHEYTMGAMQFRTALGTERSGQSYGSRKTVRFQRKKHDRYRQVVRACLLHTSESWSWTELVVALRRESKWAMIRARRCVGRVESHSKFIVRKRFDWPENASAKTGTRPAAWTHLDTGNHLNKTHFLMKSILLHTIPEWRTQRSITAHAMDLQNRFG